MVEKNSILPIVDNQCIPLPTFNIITYLASRVMKKGGGSFGKGVSFRNLFIFVVYIINMEELELKTKLKKLQKIRRGIIKRCYQKNRKDYKNYGGRGIIMCDEWRQNPKSFYNWAMENGYETHLELDRIDSNGNYEPGNCRFISNTDNCRNRRTTVLTVEIVQTIKRTDWGNMNYRQITEAVGLDGKKNVCAVWGVLKGNTWKEIE